MAVAVTVVEKCTRSNHNQCRQDTFPSIDQYAVKISV